jgi:hypothetical protein
MSAIACFGHAAPTDAKLPEIEERRSVYLQVPAERSDVLAQNRQVVKMTSHAS